VPPGAGVGCRGGLPIAGLRTRFRPLECYLGPGLFPTGIYCSKYFFGIKNSSWGVGIARGGC
jgi:hypothetical protein